MTANDLLSSLGVPAAAHTGGDLVARSPIDGLVTGAVHAATPEAMTAAIGRAQSAFLAWRNVPAPRRGELVRLLGATLSYEDRVEPGAMPGYEIPGPVVYAFWHRSLLACANRFRRLNIAILISSSFDGELIARTVQLLGFTAIRGSSTDVPPPKSAG